jgi:hypothetical protein
VVTGCIRRNISSGIVNNDGHFVSEQQKTIPEVSYKALKARGKKICARHVTSITKFLNLFKKRRKSSICTKY